MRVLVQRVTSAAVRVGGEVVAQLDLRRDPPRQGLVALVGVTHGDDGSIAAQMAQRLWRLRILDDQRSAADVGAPVLVISQFTLYADTNKGRRPSWNGAAPADVARPLVAAFVAELEALGASVGTGIFGADMAVELINDGPVTLLLEIVPPPPVMIR